MAGISVKEKTRVVLLGTGTPIADPDRAGTSVAIVAGGNPYVVDFGPGVVRRVEAARRTGVEGLTMDRLTRAFTTHLHSDHTAGLADLILTPWVLGRREPIEIYGPPGIRAMVEHLLEAYRQDIHERLHGLEKADNLGWQVSARKIKAGIVYEDTSVTVEAFPVVHGTWKAFGYKFTTQDRTIVVSGDTAPAEAIVEKARGCDVLVHEVYSTSGFAKGPPHWQTYHASMHTSARQLAEIASRARPGLLVLYHQLFWGTTEEALLEEIRDGYGGEVVSGRDLDVY